jgi:1-acyl-sn-glycerol-3-phosphate acyltransferase
MNPFYWIGQRFFREVSRAFFVVGRENLNLSGPAIIASNHVSYLDPPFIGAAFDESIYFMARKTLMRHAFVAWLFKQWQVIGVDRDKPDPSTLKTIFRKLEEGHKVILFPEGTRSLTGDLGPGEPGIGMIIARSGVPVIPVRIFGAHEALPRDKKLPQPARITVAVGKPWQYDPAQFADAGREKYQRISDAVMQQIAALHAQ